MLWMWGKGTQKVGVSKDEREKEGESGTTVEGMEESKGTLWGEGTSFKRSSHEHGRVDDVVESSDFCRV